MKKAGVARHFTLRTTADQYLHFLTLWDLIRIDGTTIAIKDNGQEFLREPIRFWVDRPRGDGA